MRDNQNLLRKSFFSPSRVTFTVYMYLYLITLKNKQKFYYIERAKVYFFHSVFILIHSPYFAIFHI